MNLVDNITLLGHLITNTSNDTEAMHYRATNAEHLYWKHIRKFKGKGTLEKQNASLDANLLRHCSARLRNML